MPINACTPSMGGSEVASGMVSDSASSKLVAVAPIITASHDTTPTTPRKAPRRSGTTFIAAPTASPASSAPSTPMLSTLAPSAEMPPSANANAWTAITTAMTRHASHGPSRTAASVAPRK